MSDLSNMSRAELDAEASKLGLDASSYSNKAELVDAIASAQPVDATDVASTDEMNLDSEAKEVLAELGRTHQLRAGWVFDGARVYRKGE
jgi:hypothetical protein